MAGTLYLDKKVGDLKLWELYMGFVILQLLIGIGNFQYGLGMSKDI